MKHLTTKSWMAAGAAILFAAAASMRAEAAGLLKPAGGEDHGATIQSHNVKVTLNNGFARTEVDQVFGNKSSVDYEAIYSFPLPRRASLSELSLWIDGREIVGEVLEKQRARQVYERQKAQGNDAALGEKNDHKTFDIHVGNVRAGKDTRVRLVYYQPIEIDLNVGRYVYPLAEGGVDEERIQFWSVDDQVSGTFRFDFELKSAFPVKDVRVPGFQNDAEIARTADGEETFGERHTVLIEKPEGHQLNKDIVVYYRLSDTTPARVELIPYRDDPKRPGTFMVVVTPAADLKRINEGTDWMFVLDISGSMSGHKIKTLTDGVSRVLGKMSPNDRFGIVTFNNHAQRLTPDFLPATPENVQAYINRVRQIHAKGGTALFAGLGEAYRCLDADRTTGIILVTDGVANVGEVRESEFLKLTRKHDLRLFTFVIGNSANRPLMERLAKDSGGFAMNISDADDIVGLLIQAKAKVLHECLHDVQLTFKGEKVTQLTPTQPGNLYMGQQLVCFGRYDGVGEVKVELTARVSGEKKSWHCRADLPDVDTDNPELERLWALATIDETMEIIREKGVSNDLRDDVVDIATAYSLVTDYTSMIVLNDEAMEEESIQRDNLNRVTRERTAQAKRANAPIKNYRVDNRPPQVAANTKPRPAPTMFNDRPSPGIGTGPIGPLFLLMAAWARRRLKQQDA